MLRILVPDSHQRFGVHNWLAPEYIYTIIYPFSKLNNSHIHPKLSLLFSTVYLIPPKSYTNFDSQIDTQEILLSSKIHSSMLLYFLELLLSANYLKVNLWHLFPWFRKKLLVILQSLVRCYSKIRYSTLVLLALTKILFLVRRDTTSVISRQILLITEPNKN